MTSKQEALDKRKNRVLSFIHFAKLSNGNFNVGLDLLEDIEAVLNEQALSQPDIDLEEWTGLHDINGVKICKGNIVHWTDGGDDLSFETRCKERWDRIAVVLIGKGRVPYFQVIDSPDDTTKKAAHTFCYGNFIYKDTEKYLTVVAENKNEYHDKFSDAGECMRWVLENNQALKDVKAKIGGGE